jgi:hypothetical protein
MYNFCRWKVPVEDAKPRSARDAPEDQWADRPFDDGDFTERNSAGGFMAGPARQSSTRRVERNRRRVGSEYREFQY